MDSIILNDENNNEVEFKIIDTFGVDDNKYAALQSQDDDKILITEFYEEDGQIFFKSIADEDQLDEIIEIYEQLKKE